jgi:heat shock protein HslJ
MRIRIGAGSEMVLALLTACGSKPPAPAPIADRDWSLVSLGERVAPVGAAGRPVTLRLDANARATGFAGCNRYSASYTLASDSLRFGPAISTKMSCAEGDDLEREFLAALPEVATVSRPSDTLVLHSPSGPIARFLPADSTR